MIKSGDLKSDEFWTTEFDEFAHDVLKRILVEGELYYIIFATKGGWHGDEHVPLLVSPEEWMKGFVEYMKLKDDYVKRYESEEVGVGAACWKSRGDWWGPVDDDGMSFEIDFVTFDYIQMERG